MKIQHINTLPFLGHIRYNLLSFRQHFGSVADEEEAQYDFNEHANDISVGDGIGSYCFLLGGPRQLQRFQILVHQYNVYIGIIKKGLVSEVELQINYQYNHQPTLGLMQYQTKNACSRKPAFKCILTIVLYLALVVLHFVYIFPAIISGKVSPFPILYIMLAFHFALLIAILYNYLWILVHDPVDRIVYDAQLAEKIEPSMLTFCRQCGRRLLGSHHCRQCGRCTQQFDHHCEFLNNCIGGKNYEKFFRLLILASFFNINLIGQGVWVFIRAHQSEIVKAEIPRSHWVILGIIVLSGLLLIGILFLMFFHCYISCCLGFTTLDFIYRKSEQQQQRYPQGVLRTNQPPESERRFY